MSSHFSFWHWFVLVLFLGLPVGLMIWTARRTRGPNGPVGFGGWLLLLAIGQTLAPLRTLGELGGTIEAYEQVVAFPNGSLVVWWEVVMLAAFAVLQISVAVFMYRRSTLFPKLFFCQWIAYAVVVSLGIVVVSAATGLAVGDILPREDLIGAMVSFLGMGLWVWYVFASVRVRNTFSPYASAAATFA